MTTTTTHPVLEALTHLDEWTERFHSEMRPGSTPKVKVGHDLARVRDQIVKDGAAPSDGKARNLITEAEEAGLVVLYGIGSSRKVAEAARFAAGQALLGYNRERRDRAIDALSAKAVPHHVSASWEGKGITVTVEAAEVLAGIETPPLPDNVDPEVHYDLAGVPRP